MENAKTKPYTLRELTAEDVFPMTAIIDKVGAVDIIDCFTAADVIHAAAAGETAEKIGKDVFLRVAKIIIRNLNAVKDDLYTLLSQLSGMPRKDIAALPMNTFIHMVIDVVKLVNFRDFFPDVSKLSDSET